MLNKLRYWNEKAQLKIVGSNLKNRTQYHQIYLIAGFPKTGTSSLADWLRSSKKCYVPFKKELHYASTTMLSAEELGKELFSANDFSIDSTTHETFYNFLNLANYKNRTLVDASPSYVFFPDRLKIVFKRFKVKAIILVRDPIKASISHYVMQKFNGVEDREFEELLGLALKKKNIEQNYRRDHFHTYRYSKLIPNFLKNFDDTLVMDTKMLNNKDKKNILVNFLSLESQMRNKETPHVNVSSSDAMSSELYKKFYLELAEFFREDIQYLENIMQNN